MPQLKSITIIGGGLAGLTLGIGLRQEGIPVVIWETSHYPRHRVCGEFISGRGQEVLQRLGLIDALRAAGARPAFSAAFFSPTTQFPIHPLPAPALCLSRFVLDDLLAGRFRALGGELRTGTRWRGEVAAQEGLVRCTGRQVESGGAGRQWFGLKAHAKSVSLTADLEMHLAADSYIGLCRLAEDRVNVCGLFRARTTSTPVGQSWKERLAGKGGSLLHRRLKAADWIPESFCAVAGISLFGRGTDAECSIGDAFTVTPPVTGNGMSMAFESADLALGAVAEYAAGRLPWGEVIAQVRHQCEAAFSNRLGWARLLEHIMGQRCMSKMALPLAGRSLWLWRLLFERTR